MSGARRGHQRERAVRDWLRDRDWLAFRAPASLGVADVVALRDGSRPRLVEVKSTAGGPYEHFGPADRERLRTAAAMAGADALLAWWPPRGELHWIAASEWPNVRSETADSEHPNGANRPNTASGRSASKRVAGVADER